MTRRALMANPFDRGMDGRSALDLALGQDARELAARCNDPGWTGRPELAALQP